MSNSADRRSKSAATRGRILAAARELVTFHGQAPSVGTVAARAGVSRLTVYHHFGSRPALLAALGNRTQEPMTPPASASGSPLDHLKRRVADACELWVSNPAFYRALPGAAARTDRDRTLDHELASLLAEGDRLRPGCSLKEAEDVIGLVASFAAFDPLHQDGRRSGPAVVEILMRMAGAILRPAEYA